MLYAGEAERRRERDDRGPNWQLILLVVLTLLVLLDVALAAAAVS